MKFDFIVVLLVAFVTMAFSDDSSSDVVTNSPLVTDIWIHLKCRNNSFVLSEHGEFKCWPCNKCDSHPKSRVVEQCRKHKDAVCGCDRMFYDARHETCIYYKRCGRGLGVLKEGTLNSDVECSECPQGTYSNEVSYSAKCKNHTNCQSLGMVLLRRGDASADNTCGPPESSTILTARTGRNPLRRDTQGTRAKCSDPTPIPYGSVSSTGPYVAGDQATFVCKSGYHLTGTNTITCKSDETWTPTQAVCKDTECRQGEFRCDSGRCIRSSLQCDGTNDCTDTIDGSDEEACVPDGDNRLAIGLGIGLSAILIVGVVFFIRKKIRIACLNRAHVGSHGDLPELHDDGGYQGHDDLPGFGLDENAPLNGSTISLGAPSSCSRHSGPHIYEVVDDETEL